MSYQEIIQGLRHSGHRITPQREMIIDVLVHSERHLSAEDIYVELEKYTNTIDLATVYRTLDMLWEAGFVSCNEMHTGKKLYATHKHGPHIHLICRHCLRVLEVDPSILDPLGQDVLNRFDFKADLQHVTIFGICSACQALL